MINVTTVVDVTLVLDVAENKSPQLLGGKLQDTRKNPHVIDAGFGPTITVNLQYTMSTAI